MEARGTLAFHSSTCFAGVLFDWTDLEYDKKVALLWPSNKQFLSKDTEILYGSPSDTSKKVRKSQVPSLNRKDAIIS
jgi:hypothetical protein